MINRIFAVKSFKIIKYLKCNALIFYPLTVMNINMDKIKQITGAVALCLLILVLGSAGYMIIEKWNFIDSVYMTVITLTTVGFGEVHKMGYMGRIFTMILLFTGAGLFVYVVGIIMNFIIEGEMQSILGRKKLDKRINRMKDHFIVCGYGRIGRILCKQLKTKSSDIVVLDKDEDIIPALEKDNMHYITGDTNDETVLIKAGIKKAKYLIAALERDADNVFLVLTARQLNPELKIMARAENKSVQKKLFAAGANWVELPYTTGAAFMGHRLLRPSVSNFLELILSDDQEKAIHIEESPVSSNSELVNIMLKDSGIRQKYNIIITAIKKNTGKMIFNPSFETFLEPGDIVIALGRQKDMEKFHHALNPE